VSEDFRERLLSTLTTKKAGRRTPLAIHLANIRAHRLERDLERGNRATAEEPVSLKEALARS